MRRTYDPAVTADPSVSAAPARLLRGGRVLVDGALVDRDVLVGGDGRIAGLPGRAADGHDDVPTLDATGLVVLPGLVNAHSHADSQLTRGCLATDRLEAWIPRAQATAAALGPEGRALASQLNALDNVRHGATTTLDHSALTVDEVDAVVDAYDAVGTRAVIALQTADLPPAAWLPADLQEHVASFPGATSPSAADLVALTVAGVERIASARRVTAAVGPSAPERCSPELLAGLAGVARDHGVPVHVHLLETALQARHGDAVARLDDHGLLGPRTAVAHAVHLDDADRERLAGSGATVVHDPLCNALLGAGYPDLPAMLAAGVAVGLGTDGWTTGGGQDLIGQARVALGLPRPRVAPEHWPVPADAWAAMSTGSARAVGLPGLVGEITVGAHADLLLVDPVRAGWLDGVDPVLQIVWQGLGAGLRRALVGGRDVLVDGRATGVDEERLAHDGARAARRIADAGRTPEAEALTAAWTAVLRSMEDRA